MRDVVRCGDDLAGRVAAPFWMLTWLLTLGTFGRRLPWDTRHVQHERLNGMSPQKDEPEPLRVPPQGGSSGSATDDLVAQIRACHTPSWNTPVTVEVERFTDEGCDHDWIDVTEMGGPPTRMCRWCSDGSTP